MVLFYTTFCIKNAGSKTSKNLCELTPDNIHKVRSKTNHTKRLCSKYWKLDEADWVRKLRSLRQKETSGLLYHKISFTTLHRTNKIWVFVTCISPLFNKKQSLTPLYLLWGIKLAGSTTSKYPCKITPAKLHKVRSKIKHTQRLCSNSWQPDDSNWVRQFRSLRLNGTSRLREHKISVTKFHRKNARMGSRCLSLTFFWI